MADFTHLKAGDKVIMKSSFSEKVLSVSEITLKGYIRVGGFLFSPTNGFIYRNKSARYYLKEWTESDENDIIRRREESLLLKKVTDLCCDIFYYNCHKVTIDQAKAILEILEGLK